MFTNLLIHLCCFPPPLFFKVPVFSRTACWMILASVLERSSLTIGFLVPQMTPDISLCHFRVAVRSRCKYFSFPVWSEKMSHEAVFVEHNLALTRSQRTGKAHRNL